MERHAGTCEEIVAPAVVVGTIVLIVCGRSLMALGTSRIGAVAIADVGISVDERTAVVDVEAGVGSASGVAASLQRTIIARLTVLLEHDVDDAHRSFSGELRRRIVNHLDAVDALRGELLQNLRTVVCCQTRSLAVYPYLHTGVATQRHVAVVIHLHGGHVVEHVRSRLSCIADKLRHVESLAVYLQLHRRLLSSDCHTLEHLGVLREIENVIVDVALRGADGERTLHLTISYVGQRDIVRAVVKTADIKVAVYICGSASDKFVVVRERNLHVYESKRFGGLLVKHLSTYRTLSPSCHHNCAGKA